MSVTGGVFHYNVEGVGGVEVNGLLERDGSGITAVLSCFGGFFFLNANLTLGNNLFRRYVGTCNDVGFDVDVFKITNRTCKVDLRKVETFGGSYEAGCGAEVAGEV